MVHAAQAAALELGMPAAQATVAAGSGATPDVGPALGLPSGGKGEPSALLHKEEPCAL